MPRIKFTADPKLPRDLAHLPYRKGYEVDLSPDQAQRWVSRGVANYLPDAVPDEEIHPRALAEGEALVDDNLPPGSAATVSFDPATADEAALRAFLTEKGVTPHHRAGEAKLREMALEILTGPEA